MLFIRMLYAKTLLRRFFGNRKKAEWVDLRFYHLKNNLTNLVIFRIVLIIVNKTGKRGILHAVDD